jgi:hypothetical protein
MSLTAIVAALQAINSLLPEVVSIINSIEAAFPNATVDAKLNEVVKILQSFQTVESEVSSPLSAVTSLVTSLFASKAAATPAPAG